MTLTRRRFLTIAAALAATPVQALTEWRGMALGARARILIDHPQAARITAEAAAEIDRLEGIFSLYRADSALSRLNTAGMLKAPPFELLECLALCDAVHSATGGLFDPTVQPLWALYAESYSAGRTPMGAQIGPAQIAEALSRTGWSAVRFDANVVRLRPGMALTLNGVAQGFIADKIAALLRAQGLSHVMIDTGELRALGPMPQGGDWPVHLTGGGSLGLHQGGLASSSALGTTFDAAGKVGHILHPQTGLPATPRWKLVTVTAPGAGLADALSTSACLMTSEDAIRKAVAGFEGASLAHLA